MADRGKNTENRAKVLLMGRARAGKTSMKSIIFANYMARETNKFQTTMQVEHNSLLFMGNRGLNLWDCGGQDIFMENYFESQKETIFDRVEVMIYVLACEGDKRGRIEAGLGDAARKDLLYFRNAMEALQQHSPHASVFCLVHKMDLVHESRRDEVLKTFETAISENSCGFEVTTYGTSIWDATLFRAWSAIVSTVIPEIQAIQSSLDHCCDLCNADEVVLFEKNTFLLIAYANRKASPLDNHRFEKLSNIVKQFKLSCKRALNEDLDELRISTDEFTATIERFLTHSAIMVVVEQDRVKPAAVSANIMAFRKGFIEASEEKGGLSFMQYM